MKQRMVGLGFVAWWTFASAACGNREMEAGAAEPEATSNVGGEQHASREPEPTRTPLPAEPPARSEPPAEVDGMQVEGILGSLASSSISRAMAQHMDRFTDCFVARYDAIAVLSGDAALSFRVRQDGRVRWVHLTESTVGDRDTERCLLRVASDMRFSPGPAGGEAEFQHRLTIPVADDVRPPVAWASSRVRTTLRQHGPALRACSVPGENLRVTVYIDPGATVTAVGASFVPSNPELDAQVALDCVTRQVAQWTFPEPGSYTAKVTFEAP